MADPHKDWQRGTSVPALLGTLDFDRWGAPAADRKLRLTACACLRQIWDRLEPGDQRAVELAEQFAGGTVTGPAREALREERVEALRHRRRRRYAGRAAVYVLAKRGAHGLLASAIRLAAFLGRQGRGAPRAGAVQAAQARAMREIVGDPGAPAPAECSGPAYDPARAVAGAIDREGSFGELPVLADALEDAGHADAALLGHLRGAGPHWRGCWAVDHVLGWARLQAEPAPGQRGQLVVRLSSGRGGDGD
jgi:hypothetical protein